MPTNTPQDYSGAFNEDINAMESVSDFNAQGMPNVPGMNYVDTHHPENPDHVFAHGISDLRSDNAIDPKFLRKPDTWRGLQTLPKYLSRMTDNARASLDSSYGGAFFSGPITSIFFPLHAVSTNTLTLKCADAEGNVQDPRAVTTWSGVSRDSLFDPYEGVSEAGCFPQVFVGIRFHNSVIKDRVRPEIMYPDFSGMPDEVDATDTFSIVVNQNCTNADVKIDDSDPVMVEMIAEYQRPEPYIEVHDQYDFPMVETIRVYAAVEWASGNRIILFDGSAGPCGAAFPNRTRGNIWGTFQIEVSANGGTNYSDVTAQFEENGWPRFVITGKAGVDLITYVYLGPIAEDARDYTSYTHVRVRYMYPVAHTGIENARIPQQQMCAHSQRDYMNWVGNKSTIIAKDIDDEGNHWLCVKHRVIPADNANNYSRDCQQHGAPSCGGCPFFSRKIINIVDEAVIGQITSGQGYVRRQSAPGANTVMDWIWELIGPLGLIWLLTPRTAYESNMDIAYQKRTFHVSGGFCMVDADDPHYTVDDGFHVHTHIKFVRGAIWNYEFNGTGLDWNSNRFPADVFGILARRIPEIMTALTQLSEEPDATTDPNYQIRSERLGRKIALGHRDTAYAGTDLAFSARSIAGIEGENRIQRLFTALKYVSGIDKNRAGRQGNSSADHIIIYATPRTIAGVENVRAAIQWRARGTRNYGYKRIGGAGLNGQVWDWEDAGGGLFALHAAPGRWNATYIDGGPGERHTVDVTFLAGGNVCQITPPHFAPDGAPNNPPGNVLVNGAHGKAVAGDTVEFLNIPALAGMQFLIVQVFPCGGNAFSGARAGVQTMHIEALGPFMEFDEFQEDGASPTITITDYETKFTGTVGTYESIGAGAVRPVLNTERPYTYTGDPLDTPELYLDRVISFDDAQYADIAAIYKGGDDHTVIEFDDPPGFSVGTVINLRNTPNSGESDGNHTITGIASDTIFVTHREDLSGPGEGATGQWIEVKAGAMVQVGSGRLYPSFPVFGWIASRITSVLVLAANKIRVSYSVDGIPQTPKELTITTPRVTLLHAGSLISVQHVNRVTGAYEDLVYAGISSNPFDIFANENYLNFKYNPDTGELYFHPLLAGDHVVISYMTDETTSTDGLGEPGSYKRDFQQIENTDYLKFLDMLHIQEWNGILAAQPAGTFDNAQFKVSSALAAKEVTEIAHSPSGEATWTAQDAEHWVHCQPLGQTLVKQSGWELWPDLLNLRGNGTWADRSFKISAEFMQMLLKCIGCLDTIPFGFFVEDIGEVGLGGFFNYGFTSITLNGYLFDTQPNGAPGARGLYDYNLPGAFAAHGGVGPGNQEGLGSLLRIPSSVATAGKHYLQIDEGNYWFGPYTPGGTDPAFTIGIGGAAAFLAMRIYRIHYPHWLQAIPDDVEIVDAEIEVLLPEDAVITHSWINGFCEWDVTINGGKGGLTGIGGGTFGSETDQPLPGGFALMGFDKTLGASGAWVPLGSFVDADALPMTPGAWGPVKAVALLEKLRTLKPSIYQYLAIYPAPFESTPDVPAGLDGVGFEDVGILDQVIKSYGTYEATDLGSNSYFIDEHTWTMTMDNPIHFGAAYVQFKLPTGHLQSVRFQPGGAFPDMRPA